MPDSETKYERIGYAGGIGANITCSYDKDKNPKPVVGAKSLITIGEGTEICENKSNIGGGILVANTEDSENIVKITDAVIDNNKAIKSTDTKYKDSTGFASAIFIGGTESEDGKTHIELSGTTGKGMEITGNTSDKKILFYFSDIYGYGKIVMKGIMDIHDNESETYVHLPSGKNIEMIDVEFTGKVIFDLVENENGLQHLLMKSNKKLENIDFTLPDGKYVKENYFIDYKNGEMFVQLTDEKIKGVDTSEIEFEYDAEEKTIKVTVTYDYGKSQKIELGYEWTCGTKKVGDTDECNIGKDCFGPAKYVCTITVSDGGDYPFTIVKEINGVKITPKSVNVEGVTIEEKTYDGTYDATITGLGHAVGICDGDKVNIIGPGKAEFTEKDAGTDIPVTVTGLSLDNSNYVLGEVIAYGNIVKRTSTEIDFADIELTAEYNGTCNFNIRVKTGIANDTLFAVAETYSADAGTYRFTKDDVLSEGCFKITSWLSDNSGNVENYGTITAKNVGDLTIKGQTPPSPPIPPYHRTHAVTYDAAGGSDTPYPDSAYENSTFMVKEYYGTKDGYRFTGWKNSEDGKIYQPCDICEMHTEDLTFTAQWEKIPVPVPPEPEPKPSEDSVGLIVGVAVAAIAAIAAVGAAVFLIRKK